MVSAAIGYVFTGISSLCFGTCFTIAKKYDYKDGLIYQWLFCLGACLLAQPTHFATGQPQFEPFAMLGGFLWCVGNVMVVPVIRYIGLSLGVLLWGGTTILMGWGTGQFGWFGVKKQSEGGNTMLSVLGVIICVMGLALFIRIKPTVEYKAKVILTLDQEQLNQVEISRSDLANIEPVALPIQITKPDQDTDDTDQHSEHEPSQSQQRTIKDIQLMYEDENLPDAVDLTSFAESIAENLNNENFDLHSFVESLAESDHAGEFEPVEREDILTPPALVDKIKPSTYVQVQPDLPTGTLEFTQIAVNPNTDLNQQQPPREFNMIPAAVKPANLASNQVTTQSVTNSQRLLGVVLALGSGLLYGAIFTPIQYLIDHPTDEVLGVTNHSPDTLDYAQSFFAGVLATGTAILAFGSVILRLATGSWPYLNKPGSIPAILAGIVWGMAIISFLVAISGLSLVITFPIMNTVPGLISTLWSIIFYKEISGRRNMTYLVCAFAVLVGGVMCIALSNP